MRPRNAGGTPVPAGLDSCSGVCPRGWLRCERPAPSPPRRRGGSRTLPRREVSSLAPSCHCAPALPGLFFFDACPAACRERITQCDAAMQQECDDACQRIRFLMRLRAHYGGRARIFSTACWLWLDASCPVLTDLVRTVYVRGCRDVAFGHAADNTTSTAIRSRSSCRPSACRWRGGCFVSRSPALRSGNTHAAGCRRRPETA